MKRKNLTRNALFTSVISLLLCVSMLVGTTFAWFTDEVVSNNNIIKSGTLDVKFLWGETEDDITNNAAEGAIFNYDLWEPGYTVARYVQIANVGNLAFRYQLNIIPSVADTESAVNLADVIDVYMFMLNPEEPLQLSRAAIEGATPVGTLASLMADPDGAAHGVLLPAEGEGATNVNEDNNPRGSVEYAIVLKMQESAGNEYQNLSVGGGSMSVQLLATQYTWENDSFDHTYDNGADYKADQPTAVVNMIDPAELSNIEIPLYKYLSFVSTDATWTGLDTGYTFKTTETGEEAANSPYHNWHADFVVTFDKDIATGTAGLAGQYDAYGPAWYGFMAFDSNTTDDFDGMRANTACRLLGGQNIYVDYTELCNTIKVFNCGVFDVDGANKGTTIKVELRLYECEEPSESNGNSKNIETGKYITVATYSYTF